MGRFSWMLLGCLALFPPAHAASFDCNRASTTVEKLVCSDPKLDKLDGELGEVYHFVVDNSAADSRQALAAAQKTWLTQSRNKCTTTACLSDAYTARIGALNDGFDPLSDAKVTCEEMRRYPDKVFKDGIDLGSGSGSPIDVDYGCAESLDSLPFLKELSSLTEEVRSQGGPQICTGTIIGAEWRYYSFDLARAGFAPQLLAPSEYGETLTYFEQWSWESPYNFDLYKEFFAEFDKDLPILAQRYREQFRLSKEESESKARSALMLFVGRAAGSFPHESLREESQLVTYIKDEKSSVKDVKEALQNASPQEAYYALKVALYLDRPEPIITALLDRIGPIDDKALQAGDESALFAALPSHKYVKLLLDKGESVDYANSFGKTALYYAIQFDDHETAELLLSRGADVNHAYLSAKEMNPRGEDCAPDTYLKHSRRTPLMHAAQNSDVAMLKLLLKHGARLGDTDEMGTKVFDYAVMGEKAENQAYLKSLGAIPSNTGYPLDENNQLVQLASSTQSADTAVDGFVQHLAFSSSRPGVLVASVEPYGTAHSDKDHGVFLFSSTDPMHLHVLSHIPFLQPLDLVLSPDGNRLYIHNISYQGSPPDLKTELLVFDISDPTAPRQVADLPGSFLATHLSEDGRYLYLQDAIPPRGLNRGTLVYSTAETPPKLLCSNPFPNKDAQGKPPLVHSFVTFPDEALILVNTWSGVIDLYDNTVPCTPKLLSSYPINSPLFEASGNTKRTVLFWDKGLASYRLADQWTEGSFWKQTHPRAGYAIFVNRDLGLVAAEYGEELALVALKPDGGFTPLRRYLIGGRFRSVVLLDSGWAFIGEDRKIVSAKLSTNH